jgi:hypothetical protein
MSEFAPKRDHPANALSEATRIEDPGDAGEVAGVSIPGRAAREDDELRAGLAALSRLAIGHLDLKDVLRRVAECAVTAIPGADGAGLMLLEKGHGDTIVASASFVTEVDAIQYSIGEGPGLTAAMQGGTVRCGGLSADAHWPRFGPKVASLGVHSVLSLPLLTHDWTVVVGAINVYAHPEDAFSDDAVRIGELFAEPAAIAVQNAQVLAQSKRPADQLQTALNSRAVIDQALGILMCRTGSTAEQAFNRLREVSQADNVKLREVAQQVVDAAVRRA